MAAPGKFGRRPAKQAPALKLRQFLAAAPAHPLAVDYLTAVDGWEVLGNDEYGDCVAVTWANDRHLITTTLTPKSTYPNLDQVFDLYRTQNPDFPWQDDGMDIQTCLEHLVRTGGPDGVKPVAFAQVDTGSLDELRAALAIFGNLWLGITVTEANESEFDKGQAWDYVRTSREAGGHAVLAGGYDPDLRFITWATETELTQAFTEHQLDEAWVVVWPEHFGSERFLDTVDIPRLNAAYRDLTGRELPIPPPVENPPAPPPFPARAWTWLAALWRWLTGKA